MRWAVDVTGIDLDADILREHNKAIYQEQDSRTHAQWRAVYDYKSTHELLPDKLGDVWVLPPDELADAVEERLHHAPPVPNPFAVPTSTTLPSQQQERNGSASQSNTMLFAVEPESPKTKELRIFSTFLSAVGKRTVVAVTMMQPQYRGLDIVTAFLQQTVMADERLAQKFSSNPRLYKLFIADEFTGEEEMAVQLDLKAHGFSCYAINLLPAAKLYLFPQRTDLLPHNPNDINLIVNIRSLEGKPIQRQCMVPADMLAESLEATLTRLLPANVIVQGSLRIKYGPLELNINEYYNFGAGCGQINTPIAERTMLSLNRLGVAEVVVNGRSVEEGSGDVLGELADDIEISMNVEEALSFQQFEVICINRCGARQQRLLCVDSEHLYTMRPNSDALPKTTERPIQDIEEVRLFANKPKYMEIAYTSTSGFAEDHLECTTTYNLALLDEKLRIIRRELRKKAAQEEEQRRQDPRATAVKRFLFGIREKLFNL